MPNELTPNQNQEAEGLLTISAAAAKLNALPWQLRRAIKAGAIPAYTPYNSRKLVRLSEVIAVINASKVGVADVR